MNFFEIFVAYKIDLLIFLVVIVIFSYFWERRKIYALALKCNGPFAWPFFGNVLSLGFTQKTVVANYQQMCQKYPGMIRFWVLNNLFLFLTNPKDIYSAFWNPKLIQRSKDHTKIFDMVPKGIFTALPDQWKVQRKILNPLFSLENMYCYLKVFNEQSRILCEKIRANVGVGEKDIYPLIGMCVSDIAIENTLGTQMKMQTENQTFYHLLKEGYDCLFKKCLYHLFGNTIGSFVFYKTSYGKRYRELSDKLESVFKSAVAGKYKKYYLEKIQEDLNNNSNKENGANENQNEATIVDFMLKKEKFTEEEIFQQALTLFIGGSDAVASATSYTILMLAMHPEIQEEIYSELQEIFGNSDRPVNAEDLANMKYLERVINETFRLFPVPYHSTRETTEEIKIGSLTVPPGVSIFLNMLTLHRDPRYWPDPLKFDPDRFLPEEVEKRHKGCWVPFGLGHRNCIAFKYGLIMMKVVLSHVFRKYRFTTSIKSIEDIELSFHLLLRNLTGYNVTIEQR